MKKQIKEFIKITGKAVKVTKDLDKRKIPVLFIKVILIGIIPYAAAFLSSLILNWLSEKTDTSLLLTYAFWGIFIIFILMVIGDCVNRYDEIITKECYRNYEFKKSEVTLNMPYEELEHPKNNELRQKLHREELFGYGIPLFFSCFDTMLNSIISILYAVSLIIPVLIRSDLFFSIKTMIFLFVSIFLSLMASLLIKKENDKTLQKMREEPPKELLVSEYLMYDNGIMHKDGKTIRLYGFSSLIIKYCASAFEYMKGFSVVGGTKPGIAYGIAGAVKALIFGGSYLFVLFETRKGGISLGGAVLFAAILYQLAQAICGGITVLSIYKSNAVSLDLFIEYAYRTKKEAEGEGVLVNENNIHLIEFRNVSFAYPGSDKLVLKHVSLKIPTGKRLAVVGVNGSGKTTLIKLLCRLYEPSEGEILLDGINIADYNLQEYMALFSTVFQEFNILSFPLGQTIAAALEYDDQKVVDACEKVGLKERISKMANGINTPINKDYDHGVEISGGEAQKLALARAIYKDAPFFILDEPTAALDPISEVLIYSDMNKIIQQKTSIYISHRMASCKFCDEIVVFHQGELIEQGTHESLTINKKSKYYELWNAQAKYYQQEN